MRDSMHVVSRLNLKEKKVAVQNSSSMKERSVKWIAQVLVNEKVPRLAC